MSKDCYLFWSENRSFFSATDSHRRTQTFSPGTQNEIDGAFHGVNISSQYGYSSLQDRRVRIPEGGNGMFFGY